MFRDDARLSIGGTDLELEGFSKGGFSAEEDLLCLHIPQDGDDIHHGLRVIDPRSGEVVGARADGPGLGLSAFAWSPLEGDRRLAIAHERRDRHRPAIWDVSTGEWMDIELDLQGDVVPVDWWPDGRSLLLVHLHEGRHRALRHDLASGDHGEIAHPKVRSTAPASGRPPDRGGDRRPAADGYRGVVLGRVRHTAGARPASRAVGLRDRRRPRRRLRGLLRRLRPSLQAYDRSLLGGTVYEVPDLVRERSP